MQIEVAIIARKWRATIRETTERDRIISFERNGLPLLERVQGAELVRLAGVGHVPMTDEPEQVARLILEVTGIADRTHEKDHEATSMAPGVQPSEAS